jgi:hypothetical protein
MSTGNLMAQDVRALLNDLGQSITLQRVSEGAYDPATGTTGAPTTTGETVKVAFQNYAERFIDGSVVQRGDRYALVSPFGATGVALVNPPQPGDRLLGEGDTVRIVNVDVVKPSGQVAGYGCQVRE